MVLPTCTVPRTGYKRQRKETHISKTMWTTKWSACTRVIGLLLATTFCDGDRLGNHKCKTAIFSSCSLRLCSAWKASLESGCISSLSLSLFFVVCLFLSLSLYLSISLFSLSPPLRMLSKSLFCRGLCVSCAMLFSFGSLGQDDARTEMGPMSFQQPKTERTARTVCQKQKHTVSFC